MTFLRRIIHENNNLLCYYNVSSSLFFTFRFITTVKTLTHCDHGNYFLRRSKGSFLESSVTAVFRIHNTARNISQKNSNNLKHLTKCLWYQIWPLVKAIDTRISSPLFKKNFFGCDHKCQKHDTWIPHYSHRVDQFCKGVRSWAILAISYSYKVAETTTFINIKLFSII